MDSWRQIPRMSMEERLSAGVVKELLVRTEADLKMAKRWIVARNLMSTGDDPDQLDIQDPDVATEMIVESSKVINKVTDLAERWRATLEGSLRYGQRRGPRDTPSGPALPTVRAGRAQVAGR